MRKSENEQSEFKTLTGNRIINVPLAADWLIDNTIYSKCKQGILRVVKEQKHGFASTLNWQCDVCNTISILKTSPKQDKKHEVNTHFVVGLKTSRTGSSYKVMETFAANLDLPTISRSIFFDISKSVGETMQQVAQQSANEALQSISNIDVNYFRGN